MEVTTLLVIFLGILFLLYGLGVPVAFAMIGTVIIMMLLPPVGLDFNLAMVSNDLYYGVNSFALIALPFYIYLGRIMNRSGLTQDIFDFAMSIVGQLRGGIIYVNIVASLIFSGMSGLALADAAGLGRVEYAAMRARGIHSDVAVGVTGSSALIGPIIPPSVPIIIYAVLAEVSIGRMFLGGIIPGFILAAVLTIFVFFVIRRRGYESDMEFSIKNAVATFKGAFLGLVIPAIVIGGILLGYFTATEAGAVAVLYGVIVSAIYGNMSLFEAYEEAKYSMVETFALTIIIVAATIYGLAALRLGIPQALGELITAITVDPTYIMFVFIGIFLLIGTFMNVTPSLVILTPILIPIVHQVGVDPLHFGIVMILTLLFGLLTPPFGVILFVLEKVTDVSLKDVMIAIIPFYIPLFIALLIVALIPETVTWIPYELMQ